MDNRLVPALPGADGQTPRDIPEGFILGAAAAAYQIEGAAFEDGRAPSIWDTFSHTPGAIVGGDTGDVACDHYHRYRSDVAIMKQMGLDSYRFSVSWARVCPDGKTVNRKGLDFYRSLVEELLDADILPWLTLYHWDLPQALQDVGGWTNRDTSYWFRDYAMKVHEDLGDAVPVWTTLNEPWCSSFLSYTGGEHAPGHQSLEEGLLASHHLLLGHGLAAAELAREDPSLRLGLTLNLTFAQPLDPASERDRQAASLVDGQMNRWFLDPVFHGSYPEDIVDEFARVDPAAVRQFQAAVRPGDLSLISTKIDTLGINYYQPDHVTTSSVVPLTVQERTGIVKFQAPPNSAPLLGRKTASPMRARSERVHFDPLLPRTAQNWQIDPLMLKELLLRVHRDYSGPAEVTLFVTENGAAFDDEVTMSPQGPVVHDPERVAYLRLHLGATLDAVEAGANVGGYFYWSFLDNFEWAWGYEKRFGIVYVDYQNQERIVKDSGKEYQRIIAARELDIPGDAGRWTRRGSIVEGRN